MLEGGVRTGDPDTATLSLAEPLNPPVKDAGLVAPPRLGRRLSLLLLDRSVGQNDMCLLAERGQRGDQLVVAELEEHGEDFSLLIFRLLQLIVGHFVSNWLLQAIS